MHLHKLPLQRFLDPDEPCPPRFPARPSLESVGCKILHSRLETRLYVLGRLTYRKTGTHTEGCVPLTQAKEKEHPWTPTEKRTARVQQPDTSTTPAGMRGGSGCMRACARADTHTQPPEERPCELRARRMRGRGPPPPLLKTMPPLLLLRSSCRCRSDGGYQN